MVNKNFHHFLFSKFIEFFLGEKTIKYILDNNKNKINPKIFEILSKCLLFDYKIRLNFKQIKQILSETINLDPS